MLGVWRKDVQNAAAHGDLTATLYQIHPLIPELHQSPHQHRELMLVTYSQPHWLNITEPACDGLDYRAYRSDDHVNGAQQRIGIVGMRESTKNRNATADGVRGRRHPLMRKGLPRRQHRDLKPADQSAHSRREVFGLLSSGRDHQQSALCANGLGCGQQCRQDRLHGARRRDSPACKCLFASGTKGVPCRDALQ